ncbi:DUF4326 domain-containing protein [uncultured Jatrophihabitans sp.]|uniref:DUF4326 domain-containing protein n=1 Tax=uncultured Jatrophihabitans sp. TaxID=1610747 RepID=UPI0035CA2D8F
MNGRPRRPERIQLRRTKGWRKPAGVIVVARPSRWGNPFRIGSDGMTRAEAVAAYRTWAATALDAEEVRRELGGHDLACWCPLAEPCHADVLLELANPCRV